MKGHSLGETSRRFIDSSTADTGLAAAHCLGQLQRHQLSIRAGLLIPGHQTNCIFKHGILIGR